MSKQILKFMPSKMGKKKGWCLQNCRLGFGIKSGKFASAKADMEWQRRNGKLHNLPLPSDVSVPVYCDTTSKYEHVVVWHNGKIYEDGYIRTQGIKGLKIFGWGEYCDGQKVIEYSEQKQAVSQNSKRQFLPTRGYWKFGDLDSRVGLMAHFLRNTFPSYSSQLALGNYFGVNLQRSVKEFQRRTGLEVDGNVGPKTYAMLKKYGFKY